MCVACSFPFLFVGCITCSTSPDWSQFIYYAPFVIIFQFGWASTQINHLSLIPDLTDDVNERVGLNGSRYITFTLLSYDIAEIQLSEEYYVTTVNLGALGLSLKSLVW